MRLPLILAAAVALPSAARAQAVAPDAPAAAAAVDTGVVAMRSMNTALRQLAGAEERYYGEHGTYTTDVAALGLLDAETRSGRAPWVAVAFAGGRGWSAEARHRALKGKSCVMYVGAPEGIPGGVPTTAAEHRAAEQMGAPTCDSIAAK